IVDLITIQFLMSRDREIPKVFQQLNRWGVPGFAMVLATVVPMLLVLLVKDMAGLADLYAVGVVGAIATNLGASSTDRKLSIKAWERALMRSEEHTSELQSLAYLVCRLLLEKKKR